MNSTRTLAAAALFALALAGCGNDAGTEASGSPSPSTTPSATTPAPSTTTGTATAGPSSPAATLPGEPPAADATADLTVEFSPDGEAVTRTYRLVCAGTEPLQAEGVPDPTAACAQVSGPGVEAFTDRSAGGAVSCTQQIAGMQRATVTGSVDGQPVDAAFALTDGCQISRWEQLTGLLGPAEGTL